jgi:hypothetical protein
VLQLTIIPTPTPWSLFSLLQILAVPGYPEENSKVRMMCLKRYADFKTLRANLLEVVEARRRQQARASSGTGTCGRYSLYVRLPADLH